jgi:putative RNA 2'-phosphotransferase
MQKQGRDVTIAQLRDVVATNDKKRFEFNSDETQIRASQGHSVDVELGYQAQIPPDELLHGTVERFADAIRAAGLIKGKRHHVHLHTDIQVAKQVGERRGQAVILRVDAQAMHVDGYQFFISTNGVWLTDHVPSRFIRFPSQ